jgi:hypothetical protein
MVVDVIMPVKNLTEYLFVCYSIHIEYSSIIIKLNLTFHCKVCMIVVLVYTCYRSQDILSFGHDFLASVLLKPLKKNNFFYTFIHHITSKPLSLPFLYHLSSICHIPSPHLIFLTHHHSSPISSLTSILSQFK